MSSSSRRRPDRRGALVAALAVAACAPLWFGAAGAAADQLDVVAVLPAADQVSLVAAVAPPPDRPIPAGSFSVTALDTPVPTRTTPVVSDQLSVAMVVDASAAGASALQPGLTGAASFLLQLPVTARTSAVTDSDPPAVVAPPEAGAKDALSGLNAVRAGGDRNTSDALSLALRQLPAAADQPRVVVLYTSAPDAGGEAAADLAGRLREARALLAVVTPDAPTPYWSSVAQDTGGVVAGVGSGRATSAFDRVAAALRGRYLLVLPTPGQLPATVSVRVETAGGRLSADAVVPAAPVRRSADRGVPAMLMLALGVGALILIAAAAVPLRARSGSRAGDATGDQTSAGQDQPVPQTVPIVLPAAEAPAPAAPTRSPPVVGPAPPPAAERRDSVPGAQPQDPVRAAQRQDSGRGAERQDSEHATRQRGFRPAAEQPRSPSTAEQPASAPADKEPRSPSTAERLGPAPPAGKLTYTDLDAHVAQAAAEVENGLLDRRQAVAQLALAARGRADLLDRIIETEQRMAHSTLDRWPPTATVLDLLAAARRVTSGDTALVGPDGVRVEQTVLRTHEGPRTLLRLSRNGSPVSHRWTVEELADDVDLSTLIEDPH